ncbi:hypothetical protein [Haloarchaeobius litoreus]|uniref:Uncharacterized protein n=1 Tax=Haloarchaeobius litoreus TaxID=755306 RepID=A0ABD6DG63_9EURY|nr:hypothetical protein [Haloarchaeobius litoreus]
MEEGEAVVAHETNLGWAEDIMSDGFENPYRHHAEDNYQIPNSKRHGCIFFWPHLIEIGRHDKSGAVLLCVGDITYFHISSYSSFSAVMPEDDYHQLKYTSKHILPEEYDQLHVFQYGDYIDWLESNPNIKVRATPENLLPVHLSH